MTRAGARAGARAGVRMPRSPKQNSFRRTARRGGRYLLHAVEDVVEMLPGSLTVFSFILAEMWGILILTGIGGTLVLFRNFFMSNADFIKNNAAFITDVINALVDFANISGDIIEAIIVVIGGIASIFTGKPSFPTFHPVDIKYVNSTSLQEACVTLPRACANIDTPEALFRIAATPYISNATCGFFRFLVPVPWLFNALYPPAAALSLTYPPFPPGVTPADLNATGTANDLGNNCQCQQETFGCTYEWQCIVLGSGYFILELVLPLLLLGAMWQGWAEHLFAAAGNLTLAAATVGVRAVGFATVELVRLDEVVVGAIEAWKRRAILAEQEKGSGSDLGFIAQKGAPSAGPDPDPNPDPEPPDAVETTGLLIGF